MMSALGIASQDQLSSTYVMVKNGTATPITTASHRKPGQTLYLSSAVVITQCSSKPSPTPKPAHSPKPTPPQVAVSAPINAPITIRKSSSSKACISASSKSSEEDPGDDYGEPKNTIPDPIQPVNMGVFWFNHQLYHYVFTPLNMTYKFLIPQPARTGISNVFLNAEYPTRCVNDLLQWKPKRAGLETEKFLINTTAGVGGIFKVSDKIPHLVEVPQTDTAATLAKWKIPTGCYIVWPILGPKSIRDTVGFVGDIALDPVTWITYGAVGGLAGASSLALSAPETTTKASDKLDNYETVTHISVNKYSAVKSAYEQSRRKTESN